MSRKLLLPASNFPDKFMSSSIVPPATLTQQQYLEEKIIRAINNYNPKLNISTIEYIDFRMYLPYFNFFGKYIGVIIEDVELEELQRDDKNIVIYVFIADLQGVGRNTFCQAFFPELIEFMDKYKFSPSFSIANHPICFVNFENTNYPDSIVKQTAGLIVSDIDYIEAVHVNSDLAYVPTNIKQYLSKFENAFEDTMPSYSSDFFEIDLINKLTIIKTNKLIVGEYLKIKENGDYDFDGSSEKFYWMEILPIVFLSMKNEYKIDYSFLESFYTTHRTLFSAGSSKMKRFDILIRFIKKIVLGANK
jgi:hypothetical protein